MREGAIDFFRKGMGSIRDDISNLKKQIYFVITTSLSNRFNPYNKPYEKQGVWHYSPFGSKKTIAEVIALNIPDEFLYNPYTKEKKFIIRQISQTRIDKEMLKALHSGTVLTYHEAIAYNKEKLVSLVQRNRERLSHFFSDSFLENFGRTIDNAIWFEEARQIIILLQFIYYTRHSEGRDLCTKAELSTKKEIYSQVLTKEPIGAL